MVTRQTVSLFSRMSKVQRKVNDLDPRSHNERMVICDHSVSSELDTRCTVQ